MITIPLYATTSPDSVNLLLSFRDQTLVTVHGCVPERNADPLRPPRWRQQMRKIISFGISTMLILVAISMWAASKPSHQNQSEISKASIATFDLMSSSKDLPARQYDAH
jgi:hypothetical protein